MKKTKALFQPQEPLVFEKGEAKNKSVAYLLLRNPYLLRTVMRNKDFCQERKEKVERHLERLVTKGDQKEPVRSCCNCEAPVTEFTVVDGLIRRGMPCCGNSACESFVERNSGGFRDVEFYPFSFSELMGKKYNGFNEFQLKQVAELFVWAFKIIEEDQHLTKKRAFNFFKD